MLVAEKILTAKEYLELEKNSEVKHEFVHGNLIEMAGESKKANKIALNLASFFHLNLDDKFEVFSHDVKVEVEIDGIYRYPDVMVALASDDEDDYLVKMPVLLAEVVSPSSKFTDNNDKLVEYTAMSSTAYYLIIQQDEMSVKFYRRNGELWEFLHYKKPTDIINLPALKSKIKLSEIYKKVDLLVKE